MRIVAPMLSWSIAASIVLTSGISSAQAPLQVTPRASYEFTSAVNWVAFRPSSTDLAVAMYAVKQGGKAIVCKSWFDKRIKDTTVDTMPGTCFCVAFSATGTQLAWCSWTPSKQIRFADDLGQTKSIDCGKAQINSIAIDPQFPNLIASNAADGTVRIWNSDTRKMVRDFPPMAARGAAVIYSPDGRQLAAGFKNNRVRVWRLGNIQASPLALDTHTAPVNAIAFSPNSRLLATGSSDHTVKLWDVIKGTQLTTLKGDNLDPINTVAFTPDGKFLITGDQSGRVVIWSVEDYRTVAAFAPHRQPIFSLAISSDGEYLATGSQDRTLKVFRTAELGYRLGRIRLANAKEKYRIKIDGAAAAPNESLVINVLAGPHEVEVTTEDGTNSKSYKLTVSPDAETLLPIDVMSTFGRLFVQSPQPAAITVQGGPTNVTARVNETVDKLSPGHYDVLVVPDDKSYTTFSVPIDIKAGETARITAVPTLGFGNASAPADAAKLLQRRLNPRDGADMIWIPGCTFTMGRANGAADAKPPHTVVLAGYWIYKNPVTVGQYRRFCRATAGTENAHKMPDPPTWGWQDDQPMVLVSWQDAIDYGQWAFGNTSKHFLPTEAQYERAMQGPEGYEFPWGNTFVADQCINSVKPNHPTGPLVVGTREPNGYGLSDIAGNVWEWCEDWYDPDIYKKPAGSSPTPNKRKCVRGGSWNGKDPKMFRSDFRGKADPEFIAPDVGFRCAAG